jgi:hypothetical protein
MVFPVAAFEMDQNGFLKMDKWKKKNTETRKTQTSKIDFLL